MRARYTKTFLKELSKLPEEKRKHIEDIVFAREIDLSRLDIKKFKGWENYFRVKVGRYRIGIKIEEDIIEFRRVLQRKDIYRHFP